MAGKVNASPITLLSAINPNFEYLLQFNYFSSHQVGMACGCMELLYNLRDIYFQKQASVVQIA